MFESAIIRRNASDDQKFDVGDLAETILFYGKTHLFLDRSAVRSLINSIGLDNLVRLCETNYVNVSYTSKILGCQHPNSGLKAYNLHILQLVAHADGKKISKEDDFIEAFHSATVPHFGRDRKIKRILKKTKFNDLDAALSGDANIIDMTNSDTCDEQYVLPLIADEWREKIKTPLPQIIFKATQTSTGLIIDSNIEKILPISVGKNGPLISIPSIILKLLEARFEMWLAAHYNSSISTTDTHSNLIRKRMEHLISRYSSNKNNIKRFESYVFEDGISVRDCIQTPAAFSEFLGAVEKAKRFKNWLNVQHPDEDILKEYIRELSARDGISSLPKKLVRFCIFNGASVTGDQIAPGLGTAISASDSFFLSSLLTGWKPNHFINKIQPILKKHQP